MQQIEPQRVEIFRGSRIRFLPGAVPADDFDFVVGIYKCFLNRRPEFSTFDDPLDTLALKAHFVFQVMGSTEAQIAHGHDYRLLLESLAQILGYTNNARDVAQIIHNAYNSLDLLIADGLAIAEIIQRNSNGASHEKASDVGRNINLQADTTSDTSNTNAITTIKAEPLSNLVSEIFESVIRRAPSENETAYYARHVTDGAIDVKGLISEIMDSSEFGSRALMHTTVARHVAATVITTMMERDPGEEAINIYAGAIQNGYALDKFLKELLGSPEFMSRMGANRPVATAASGDSEGQLGQLAEGLIVAQLAKRGCAFPLPPRDAGAPRITPERVRSMLHTLALFGHTAEPLGQSENRA